MGRIKVHPRDQMSSLEERIRERQKLQQAAARAARAKKRQEVKDKVNAEKERRAMISRLEKRQKADETDEERLERFNREIPKLKSRLQNTSFPPIRNMLQKQIDAREKFKSQFKHAREESKSQFKQFTGTKK